MTNPQWVVVIRLPPTELHDTHATASRFIAVVAIALAAGPLSTVPATMQDGAAKEAPAQQIKAMAATTPHRLVLPDKFSCFTIRHSFCYVLEGFARYYSKCNRKRKNRFTENKGTYLPTDFPTELARSDTCNTLEHSPHVNHRGKTAKIRYRLYVQILVRKQFLDFLYTTLVQFVDYRVPCPGLKPFIGTRPAATHYTQYICLLYPLTSMDAYELHGFRNR